MKKLALLIMIMCFALHGKATNYADYVNPLIGTQSTYEFSSGNTYPAIARPWGMNFWTYELLDSSDRENGRRMAVYVYCD